MKRFPDTDALPPLAVLGWVGLASALPLFLVAALPGQLDLVMAPASYVVFHNFAELFSIMVALSIFGMGWFAYDQTRNRHALFLAAAFLAIGLMDFMHTMGNVAMPAFITENSTNKSSQFWIAARLFQALALLASAFISSATQSRWLSKGFLITSALLLSGLVFTGVTFFPALVPDTFVPGSGLTLFKKFSEYLVITLLLGAAAAYWQRMAKAGDRILPYYLAAFVISIFSEVFLTLYSRPFGTYNVLGHLYKVAAFALIYKGIFITSVRDPYMKLATVSVSRDELGREVEERRRAQEELSRSEEKYRTLFSTMTEGFGLHEIILDPEGKPRDYRFLDLNDAFERLTGLSRAGLIGKTAKEVMPAIDPHWIETYGKVALTGEPIHFENYSTPLGKWFRTYAYAPEANRFVVLFSDVTSSRRSEDALYESMHRFELLALTAGELLQSTEPQKVVDSVCGQVMEHLDCHAFFNFMVDEKAGKLHLNACAGIPEEEAGRIEWLDYGVAVCGCAARDGSRIVAEHIPSTPDERTELVKSYGIKAYACHPILGPGGKVMGTLSFGTRNRETFSNDDLSLMKAVTDQVATAMVRMSGEQDLRARTGELEAANKELESFVYSVSHDLRAPLRSVAGFAGIVREDYAASLDAQGHDYLSRICNGAEKMNQRIEALLHLSRISRQGLQRTPVDLSGLAATITADLRQTHGAGKVEVAIAEGVTASADPELLRLALANLFENAWKFTANKTNPRIEFGSFTGGTGDGTSAAKVEPGKAVYWLKDNGAGFDPAYAARMFWPFHRLHGDTEFEGIGIGLAIVERVILRHGGKVWAEGEPEKGATLFFTLG